ncbi:MAG: hypothetical protein QM621_02285 [Aeromicrobium sp.]|uniref:hypothetical protein n=1 Tax=Aeromicrobium sp. TaxID=1871063 RepID=UPI0039E30F1F
MDSADAWWNAGRRSVSPAVGAMIFMALIVVTAFVDWPLDEPRHRAYAAFFYGICASFLWNATATAVVRIEPRPIVAEASPPAALVVPFLSSFPFFVAAVCGWLWAAVALWARIAEGDVSWPQMVFVALLALGLVLVGWLAWRRPGWRQRWRISADGLDHGPRHRSQFIAWTDMVGVVGEERRHHARWPMPDTRVLWIVMTTSDGKVVQFDTSPMKADPARVLDLPTRLHADPALRARIAWVQTVEELLGAQ